MVSGLNFYVMGGSPANTWYVSYMAGGDMLGERLHRATKTFKNEIEAKEFARAKSQAGDTTLIAGTINRVCPRTWPSYGTGGAGASVGPGAAAAGSG